MSRVEVFLPAELPDMPDFLAKAFENRLTDLDCQCETVSVYGCDLARDGRQDEQVALDMVVARYGAWYRILRR